MCKKPRSLCKPLYFGNNNNFPFLGIFRTCIKRQGTYPQDVQTAATWLFKRLWGLEDGDILLLFSYDDLRPVTGTNCIMSSSTMSQHNPCPLQGPSNSAWSTPNCALMNHHMAGTYACSSLIFTLRDPTACMPALQDVSFISHRKLLGNHPRPLNEQTGNTSLTSIFAADACCTQSQLPDTPARLPLKAASKWELPGGACRCQEYWIGNLLKLTIQMY